MYTQVLACCIYTRSTFMPFLYGRANPKIFGVRIQENGVLFIFINKSGQVVTINLFIRATAGYNVIHMRLLEMNHATQSYIRILVYMRMLRVILLLLSVG